MKAQNTSKCSEARILDYWIAKRFEERQSEMC